ncbi:MAG: hypothetical protein EXR79_11385 [Myxococcales bacterium]|nr:hypothetical protein [Myxococcales bacterium]
MKTSQSLRCAVRVVAALIAATGVCTAGAVDATAQPKTKAKGEAPPEPGQSVDESTIPGEVQIGTKHEFVKFTVDGKEWDNCDYTDKNRTLVVRGLERADDHAIVMTPREGGFEPYTLIVQGAQFKKTLVKQKGRTKIIIFRATHKVDFAKPQAPAADKATPDKPAADKPSAEPKK